MLKALDPAAIERDLTAQLEDADIEAEIQAMSDALRLAPLNPIPRSASAAITPRRSDR